MFKKSAVRSLRFTLGPQSVFYTDHLNLWDIYSFDSISVQAEPTFVFFLIGLNFWTSQPVSFGQTAFLCANICLNTCIS